MERLEIVKKRLYEKNATLVVMFKNGNVKEFYGERMDDIVALLKENVDSLSGAVVADKIVGKASGGLLIVSGVDEIYADTMSEKIIPFLEENEIKYDYKNKVEYIMNKSQTGMCPMEEKFKDEDALENIFSYFWRYYEMEKKDE